VRTTFSKLPASPTQPETTPPRPRAQFSGGRDVLTTVVDQLHDEDEAHVDTQFQCGTGYGIGLPPATTTTTTTLATPAPRLSSVSPTPLKRYAVAPGEEGHKERREDVVIHAGRKRELNWSSDEGGRSPSVRSHLTRANQRITTISTQNAIFPPHCEESVLAVVSGPSPGPTHDSEDLDVRLFS
jgi:hypothetical protein